MQCDLCGKDIDTNDALIYEAVEDSKLCRSCHEMLSVNPQGSSSNLDQPSPKSPISRFLTYAIGSAIITLLLLKYLNYVEFNLKIVVLQLIFFGPSILAAFIALYSSFITDLTPLKGILILVSMMLHAISSFFVFAAVGIGEAWSGYGLSHGVPALYAFGGAAVIMFIAFRPKSSTKS
jgi:hypothetical protein